MFTKKALFQLTKNYFSSRINPISDVFIKESNPKEEIVVSKNPYSEKILKAFRRTPSNLVIVSDFDYTLTKQVNPNIDKRFFTSYCILEHSGFVSQKFIEQNRQLYKKYSIYEQDHSINFETRDFYTKKWFKENLEIFKQEKQLKKNIYDQLMVKSQNQFFFRNGIKELFELIEKYEIPLYIISGGIKEVIQSTLKYVITNFNQLVQKGLIHIVSNEFIYNNETHEIETYKEPMIYTFNKSIGLKMNYIHDKKPNVLLLGDHLRDVDMVKEFEINEIVKFGFLNSSKEDKNLENYKKSFDITILNDGDLHYLNNFIKTIFHL